MFKSPPLMHDRFFAVRFKKNVFWSIMAIGSILRSFFQWPYASDVCNLRGCYVEGLREASAFSLICAACVRSARDISRVTSQGQLVFDADMEWRSLRGQTDSFSNI